MEFHENPPYGLDVVARSLTAWKGIEISWFFFFYKMRELD